MARKGERYQQIPTLWFIGLGYPCRVVRKRKGHAARWLDVEHDVLTMATARRWKRLERLGKAIVRRDVTREVMIQVGISRVPQRAEWAK